MQVKTFPSHEMCCDSNGLFWGHVPVCSSTQDVARALWNVGEMTVCVVTAGTQLAGRGTWGRSWWSHPGNLLISISINRSLGQKMGPIEQLPLQAAKVVAAWLQSLGARTSIRGLNDVILLDGVKADIDAEKTGRAKVSSGKVCGILLETWESLRGPALTLGMGLNCASAPPWSEAQQATTSLCAHGFNVEASRAAEALLPQLLALFGCKVSGECQPQTVKLESLR